MEHAATRWSFLLLALALGCATAAPSVEKVQGLQARGTFADVRPNGRWLFDPDADGLADMPVVVTEHTRFYEGGRSLHKKTAVVAGDESGKTVEENPDIPAGEPVTITYRVMPDGTLELLKVELLPQ